VKDKLADKAERQQANDEAALMDAIDAHQRAVRANPDRADRFYREKNAREDADLKVKASRDACRKAWEEIARAVAEGASWADAIQRAKQACGQNDLNFDHRQRADEIHHEVVREVFGRRGSHGRRGVRDGVRQRTVRAARTEHGHGDRRGERSRSSSSDDPDPDPDQDSDESWRRRLCAHCGKDIPDDRAPQARYCKDEHGALYRQRLKRRRDRERSKLPPTPSSAGDLRYRQLTYDELIRLQRLVVCRCNGHHLEFEPGHCTKCGRNLPRTSVGELLPFVAFAARLDGIEGSVPA
jgi:hypothetical protein